MSLRKKLVKEAREQLKQRGVHFVCLDMLNGVTEEDILDRYEELLQEVIEDSLYEV